MHVHCCEDFRRCRAGEMAFEIPEIVYAFGPQLKVFMKVGILLTYFAVSCSSRVKTVPNLGMSRVISLTKVSSAALFHKNFNQDENMSIQQK